MPELHLIVDGGTTPGSTRRLLREAAERRSVAFAEVDAPKLHPLAPPLRPGAMLYAAGTSAAAALAQRTSWQPGVITFHRGPRGPFEVVPEQHLLFARAGLPVPRSVSLAASSPALLEELVGHLGGLPLVVRVDGGEGGVGVALAESMAGLRSLCELLLSQGIAPRLVSFVPEAVHWRLVVLGDEVLTAYANPVRADDFRSTPSRDPRDYGRPPLPELAQVAVAAAQLIGVELAGVDLLLHPSGRVYLLEANFPCYFAQATEVAGIDVAGPMLEHLLAKAASSAAAQSGGPAGRPPADGVP